MFICAGLFLHRVNPLFKAFTNGPGRLEIFLLIETLWATPWTYALGTQQNLVTPLRPQRGLVSHQALSL